MELLQDFRQESEELDDFSLQTGQINIFTDFPLFVLESLQKEEEDTIYQPYGETSNTVKPNSETPDTLEPDSEASNTADPNKFSKTNSKKITHSRIYTIFKSQHQFRLSHLVGFPGSAGVARSLMSWLGLECNFVWKRLQYIVAVSLTEQILRSEFIALLEIYQAEPQITNLYTQSGCRRVLYNMSLRGNARFERRSGLTEPQITTPYIQSGCRRVLYNMSLRDEMTMFGVCRILSRGISLHLNEMTMLGVCRILRQGISLHLSEE
ncbi:Hypothetical protein CINCED_3A000417 [Cinara cedri]|uniref:Uncharacterized protein n=1 Tax=Cinara cedri TaxID=506608 RepID=A0A5E4M7W4_9HEMI|nr:Hypothetical protein CINCED_3A000417 [Cinara cedri]